MRCGLFNRLLWHREAQKIVRPSRRIAASRSNKRWIFTFALMDSRFGMPQLLIGKTPKESQCSRQPSHENQRVRIFETEGTKREGTPVSVERAEAILYSSP
jgi:hypothetical protein